MNIVFYNEMRRDSSIDNLVPKNSRVIQRSLNDVNIRTGGAF